MNALFFMKRNEGSFKKKSVILKRKKEELLSLNNEMVKLQTFIKDLS
jgi:hypothetical protein